METFIEKKIRKPFTEDAYIEAYDEGGMSAGMITPGWWNEMATPELLKRFMAVRAK